MGLCTRAEQKSGSPLLVTYNDRQKAAMKKRPIDLKQTTAHFIRAVRDLNANTESSGKAMSFPRWASIDENAMDIREYAEAMTTWLLEGGFQGLRKLSMSELPRQMDDVNMEGMEGMEDIDDDTAEFQQPDAPYSPCIEARDNKTKKNKQQGQRFREFDQASVVPGSDWQDGRY